MTHTALNPSILRDTAAQVVEKLKVLANPERLLLLCELSQGERCVSDLEAALDIHQPTLSQQLGVLRTEGVVLTRREGKRIYYRVADEKLLALLATLYSLYCPQEATS
ncbi:MAG TPA: metalloregulator ArsR/SmtB family transcription factor [Castellaniella sp.]|uniref:metalloregulator ArsR/SmtB family transcription factor n=1 Tax=Castellaniella sp. TaxID=1955812 RepID=UPI002EE197B6